jgi:hypothetical protein
MAVEIFESVLGSSIERLGVGKVFVLESLDLYID